jgi:hypothetical protein
MVGISLLFLGVEKNEKARGRRLAGPKMNADGGGFMKIPDIVVDKRVFVFYFGYRVVEMVREGF